MKIFSWMKNIYNGKDGASKPNADSNPYHKMHQPIHEELFDWPNGILAIGTLGNSSLKRAAHLAEKGSGRDCPENTTPDDLEEVDRQLRTILNNQKSLDSGSPVESRDQNLSAEKFLDSCSEEAESQRDTSIVQKSRKDIGFGKKRRGIGKRSFSFLLKRALLCGGGHGPSPIVKDPILDTTKMDNSRIEKMLRAMLHKKIYPQRLGSKGTPRKCVDMPETECDKEECEEEGHKSKWVKTDSEYIVLEI